MEQRKPRGRGKKKGTYVQIENERPQKQLVQPSTSFADCEEIQVDDDTGKDFAQLMNATPSTGGHFVFKSEKSWMIDTEQFSEFFTLDLKTLSAAINCIPFNEYIEVEDEYFTNDQLINIQNKAEKGRKAYETVLKELESRSIDEIDEVDNVIDLAGNIKNLVSSNSVKTNQKKIDNEEEDDLDFLLSLKEPVKSNPIMVSPIKSVPPDNDTKTQSKPLLTKENDLEKWLDSVLED